MTTYRNTFHGKEATSKYTRADFARVERQRILGLRIDNRAMKAGNRLKDKLCGSAHCTCSNWYGERT